MTRTQAAQAPDRAEMADPELEGPDWVELCTGETYDGRRFYAFVRMSPAQHHLYIEDRQQGDLMSLTDYGDILSYGFAEQPPYEAWIDAQLKNPQFAENFRTLALSVTGLAASAFAQSPVARHG